MTEDLFSLNRLVPLLAPKGKGHCCFGSSSMGPSWDPGPRQPEGAFPTVVAWPRWGPRLELKGHDSHVTNTRSATVSEALPPCQGAGLAAASCLAWPLPHTDPLTLTRLSGTLAWCNSAIHHYVPNSAELIQHQGARLWALPRLRWLHLSAQRGRPVCGSEPTSQASKVCFFRVREESV